ncbi:MAG: SPASM domain-containing protein [Candidatus Marinimicrobia bacterium]|nr:SPASM domain-containing protein [Candidatus Neomarinimicrobiota bacterium]
MCPHDLMTREKGFMDVELFKTAINQVSVYSDSIRLHNMGESLLHPHFDDLIRYTRNLGIRTILSTNATALTESVSERVLKSQLDSLLISFDGASKETYEQLRDGAKFDKVIKKIEGFLSLRKRMGVKRPKVTMSLINMPMTESEVDAFRHRWEGKVDLIRIKPPRNWDGSSVRINEIMNLTDTRSPGNPCYWLWSSMVILWDGRVVPCCMDYDAKHVLGNIKEKSLEQIFNDEPMQALRQLHVEGRVSESALCRGCSAPTKVDGALMNLAGRLGKFIYD